MKRKMSQHIIPVMGLVLAIGLAGCASSPPATSQAPPSAPSAPSATPPPSTTPAPSATPPSGGSGVIKNKSTGAEVKRTAGRLGAYYQRDSATRFYVSLTEEEEQALAVNYLMDDSGNVAALDIKSNPGNYGSLLDIYEQDDKDWGLNVDGSPGTFYLTEIGNSSAKYYGIVMNLRWLESGKASYFLVRRK